MKKSITPNTNSKIATVGLDLAKNSFSVHAFDEAGNTVLTKAIPVMWWTAPASGI
jgi:hypothetical protein